MFRFSLQKVEVLQNVHENLEPLMKVTHLGVKKVEGSFSAVFLTWFHKRRLNFGLRLQAQGPD